MKKDISDTFLTVSVKTAITVIAFVGLAVMGWFRLDAKASIGVEGAKTARVLECEVRQLKDFIIYKREPVESCEKFRGKNE